MLNVLAIGGFMTFWAKCNTRSVPAVVPEAAAADGKRPWSNGTAQQGPSISHEVLLKRLSSLEDVVYRQLNGMFPQRNSLKCRCSVFLSSFAGILIPNVPPEVRGQGWLQSKSFSILFSC